MRTQLRSLIAGVITGTMVLGVAWATTGLIPVRRTTSSTQPGVSNAAVAQAQEDPVVDLDSITPNKQLPGGQFLVGAKNASISPADIPNSPWHPQGNGYNCGAFSYEYLPTSDQSCLRSFDRGNWATGVDDLGIYARAMAISNGKDTLAFVVLDAVSWFYGYDPSICPGEADESGSTDTCGSRRIANDLSEELGIPAKNFVIASTHTHASADTTARTPSWYYEFIRDQIKVAVRGAVASMQPAKLQTGAIPAKGYNIDRRLVTRAVPDSELTWIRGIALPYGSAAQGGKPEWVAPGTTISTLVNFSVHPTVTANNAVLHSGFIGHLAKRMNELWGGSTVFYPGGLGDQTVVRDLGRDGIGYGLAELVYESQADAYTLQSNDIESEQRIIQIPADNYSLVAMNKAGVFMRDATVPGPHAAPGTTSVQSKHGNPSPSCVGAGGLSVLSPVGGFRIGKPGEKNGTRPDGTPGPIFDRGDAVVIMQAPGEIFSSISLTTKDYLSRARNVLVLGMSNDHIGYIIPAQQYDNRAANAAGIAAPSHDMTDYEESLSTGRCTGDQVLNALLQIGETLGVMGNGEGA